MVNAFHVTYNQTLNDRPLPVYFTPTDLGVGGLQPAAGLHGRQRHGNGFTVGTGGTNPGYFNSDSFQLANDLDVVRGRHQLSFGGNWIHTKIETLNNRPTNGQFTFNGQATGLVARRLHARARQQFPAGQPGLRLRRQRLRRRLRAGRLEGPAEPDAERRPALGAVPRDQELEGLGQQLRQARFDAGIRSTVYPQAPAGLLFPGDDGFPGSAAMNNKLNQFAPRAGVVWQANEKTAIRGGWGMFYDTPHLFFNTRFANNPPWGAQITLTNPAGGFADPYLAYPGGNPFPALDTGWQTQPFPPSASTSTRRSTRSRRRCSSGTSARSGRSATGC